MEQKIQYINSKGANTRQKVPKITVTKRIFKRKTKLSNLKITDTGDKKETKKINVSTPQLEPSEPISNDLKKVENV